MQREELWEPRSTVPRRNMQPSTAVAIQYAATTRSAAFFVKLGCGALSTEVSVRGNP
jgi:hypothetical protein